MSDTLKLLLLVEDDDNDIIITKRKIAKSSLPVVIGDILIARTVAETKQIISKQSENGKGIDILLLDLNLPDSQGLDTVDAIRPIYDRVLIVLTSVDDEMMGIEAIKRGADDYLVKSQLNEHLLSKSVYYSIERRRMYGKAEKVITKLDKMEVSLAQQATGSN